MKLTLEDRKKTSKLQPGAFPNQSTKNNSNKNNPIIPSSFTIFRRQPTPHIKTNPVFTPWRPGRAPQVATSTSISFLNFHLHLHLPSFQTIIPNPFPLLISHYAFLATLPRHLQILFLILDYIIILAFIILLIHIAASAGKLLEVVEIIIRGVNDGIRGVIGSLLGLVTYMLGWGGKTKRVGWL